MATRLIGIAAPAPGCGKSAVAQFLHDQVPGALSLPLAGTLKAMVRTFLLEAGISERMVSFYGNSSAKEAPIPSMAGVSYRHLCQTLGTEWGRGCISPSIWLSVWAAKFHQAEADHVPLVIVEDVRFRNEAQMIKGMGGQLWWVERQDALMHTPARTLEHASEGELSWGDADWRIDNDSTLFDLERKVVEAYEVTDSMFA